MLICAAAQDWRVRCTSGDVCVQEAEGVSFFMTSKLLAYGRVALYYWQFVFLVPNPPFFFGVFSRKKQTPASTHQSLVQTSRSVDPQCGAYLLSDLRTPAAISITHCYNTTHFHSRPLSDKSADCMLKWLWFVYHQWLKCVCVCVCVSVINLSVVFIHRSRLDSAVRCLLQRLRESKKISTNCNSVHSVMFSCWL